MKLFFPDSDTRLNQVGNLDTFGLIRAILLTEVPKFHLHLNIILYLST